jgi:hypothetical protein
VMGALGSGLSGQPVRLPRANRDTPMSVVELRSFNFSLLIVDGCSVSDAADNFTSRAKVSAAPRMADCLL